jgi:hypothetical protein
MCESLDRLVDALGSAVSSLEPSSLSAADAVRFVDLFSRIERLGAAGRTLAAGRVAATGAWRASSHRSAAHWLAARTRQTVADAVASLQTATAVTELPATGDALRSGVLSGVQAAEITAAATADPAAEGSLLVLAEEASLTELRDRARVVRAAAASDEDATERIRRGRYLRHWTDTEGALRLDVRLAPDDGAQLLAVVETRAGELADEARRSGLVESAAAHAADALVGLAGAPGPRAVVHVRVDQSALIRGRTVPGEECQIPGVGPITVASAKRLATGGAVKVIATLGADVTRVAHLGRTIPARVRTALEARDPVCVVPGCDTRIGLEIDHIVGFVDGGPTTLDNLARLCRFHHAAKTHHGWVLGGRPGAWTWTRRGGNRIAGRPPQARAP